MNESLKPTKDRTYAKWVQIGLTLKLVLLFCLVSGLLGYVCFQSFLRQLRYKSVNATILTSKLDPCPDGMFTVDINFSYTIGRQRFTAGKFRDDFAKFCLKKKEAEAIVKQYPEGEQVEAWYDPEHPNLAVLDRSMGLIQKGFLIVMTGFAVILTLAYLFHRQSKNRSDTR